ncbi:nucleotide pyrophosphohydrolase [Bacillus methanolicus]|uniref:nucleotide pyrophosphohydrolase n=1 Tax=Bacillus methanolicus TaxID=1471 RepID=UPI0023800449|nr:nucleotide pyrophosphohydrolase [Bacillus methanolicus]MDE3840916.1 nucleotide pyrophosphohydrolase [Bacillus methanolicus]
MKQFIEEIIKFRDERNWAQFHNTKDLAVSISIEASELLENFQWKTSEQAVSDNLQNIQDEMADVFIYLVLLADNLGLDLEKITKNKMEKNALKYPVDKAYGSNKKYNEL